MTNLIKYHNEAEKMLREEAVNSKYLQQWKAFYMQSLSIQPRNGCHG